MGYAEQAGEKQRRYTVENKMIKSKLVFFIVIPIFLVQSCYTVIKKNDFEKSYYDRQPKFPLNSNLNTELVGVWINKKLWMDYGYQYRRLEIKNNGSVTYIPSSERSNSEIFYGNYRVLSDTLIIIFNRRDNSEWMIYRLRTNTLYIQNIKERKGTENNLVNDCYACGRIWIKL